MGDAADDLWDRTMEREHEFSMMLKSIREHCNDPMVSCFIVENPYREEDDWLPYRCASCGQEFDFP